MSQAQVVLIVPLGEVAGGVDPGFGVGGGGHPSHGLPIGGGHPSTGPIYPGGRPDQGLPRPPVAGLPPHVWPPSNIGPWVPTPGRPSHPIQPPTSGTKPVPPESPLPAGSSLVLVYNAESGWQGAVVDQGGTTKPIAPPTAEPK